MANPSSLFRLKTSQMPCVSAEYWPWIRHASGGWSRILWLNWCPFEDADPRIGKAFHGFDIPFHNVSSALASWEIPRFLVLINRGFRSACYAPPRVYCMFLVIFTTSRCNEHTLHVGKALQLFVELVHLTMVWHPNHCKSINLSNAWISYRKSHWGGHAVLVVVFSSWVILDHPWGVNS